MDGLEITRQALKILAIQSERFGRVFRKTDVHHKIRLQPFFGHYWSGKKCRDTIKIRRPVQYRVK